MKMIGDAVFRCSLCLATLDKLVKDRTLKRVLWQVLGFQPDKLLPSPAKQSRGSLAQSRKRRGDASGGSDLGFGDIVVTNLDEVAKPSRGADRRQSDASARSLPGGTVAHVPRTNSDASERGVSAMLGVGYTDGPSARGGRRGIGEGATRNQSHERRRMACHPMTHVTSAPTAE